MEPCTVSKVSLSNKEGIDYKIRPFISLRYWIDPKFEGKNKPFKKHDTDSGFDLFNVGPDIELNFGDSAFIPTGLRIELPEGYEAQVRGRSGLAIKGLTVHLGTVDTDYRGDIGVVATNTRQGAVIRLETLTRVAQLVVMPIPFVVLEQVENLENLTNTVRGEKGFGSSGV